MATDEQLKRELLEQRVRRYRAGAEKEEHEARFAKAEADEQEVSARSVLENERRRLARDDYHHVYVFSDPVRADSVQLCIRQLAEWSRNDPGCDMEIIFNSPGGSVTDGMHLYDYIQALKIAGHSITTTALGMAASMAGILLQAGTTRVMGKEAYLLIHEVAAGAIGKIGEIKDEVELLDLMTERVARIFAKRSTLSARQVKNRMRRKDWWLDSDEALKLGLIDEIRGDGDGEQA